jgi:putative phosphoesterase
MRIGLISDTHAPAMGREPPPEVERAFAGVDLILHAGDIYTSECLDALERIAPVIAVEVPPAPVDGDPRVAYKRVLQLEGYQVGLVHDLNIRGIDEFMPGLTAGKFVAEGSLPASLAEFFGEPVNVAVFGHTHYAMVESHQGVLLVNSGSPTLPRQSRRLGSVGILELTPEGASAHIIELTTLRDSPD